MRAIQTYRVTAPTESTAVSKHRYIRVWSMVRDLFGGCRVTLSGRDGECLSLSLITFTAILPRQNLYDWCSKNGLTTKTSVEICRSKLVLGDTGAQFL